MLVIYSVLVALPLPWVWAASTSTLSDAWEQLYRATSVQLGQTCPKCSSWPPGPHAVEEERRRLRVDAFKAGLLDRLGFDTPPPSPPKPPGIPQHLLHGLFDRDLEKRLHKEKLILFPNSFDCKWRNSTLESYFKLSLPRSFRDCDVASATLWFSTRPSKLCKVLVKSCGHSSRANQLKLSKPDGWTMVDVTKVVQQLLGKGEYCAKIHLTCTGQAEDCLMKERPYLVLGSQRQKSEQFKRSLNCTRDRSDCCRESVPISFREIGWDWVVEPTFFEATYCRGACTIASYVTQSAYNGLIKFVDEKMASKNRNIGWSPCCAPTKMRPFEIAYLFNGSVLIRTVPDLAVAECGCA